MIVPLSSVVRRVSTPWLFRRSSFLQVTVAAVTLLGTGDVRVHGQARNPSSTPSDVVSGFVAVGGGRIFYESAGQGRAVVLIHDGVLHRETWDAQFLEFSRSFRTIRWDRRGYGQSPAPQSPFSHVDDLHEVMKALQIDGAALIGCSAGGMLALHFALDHPSMVNALVLVGPIVSGMPFSEHFVTRGGRGQPPPGSPIEARTTYWTSTDPWIVAPTSTDAKRRMRELLIAHPTNGAGGQHARWSEPALGRLAQIKVPTLLITGESDIPDVHAHMGAIQARISGAKRVVLPRAGHLPHLEVPETFNAEVTKFLGT